HPVKTKFAITVLKRIPLASGLGGGPSNAAALINAYDRFSDLRLGMDQKLSLAAEISMDCPFFIEGKTALCEGFGEKVSPLPSFPADMIELYPKSAPLQLKTVAAYAALNLSQCGQNFDKREGLLKLLKGGHFDDPQVLLELSGLLHNDFALRANLKKGEFLSGS